MSSYIYVEKNGNASVILTANNEEEAEAYIGAIVKLPIEWRLESIEVE
jgi:hypothetical protein